MTFPPHKIGDKGQRYAVAFRGFHEGFPDLEHHLGYSDTLAGAEQLTEVVNTHPRWHSPRIIDREKD